MPKTYLTTKLKPQRALPQHRVTRIDLITTQKRWWVDAHGNWHDIHKIDNEYLANLIAYFARNARRIFYCHLRSSMFGIFRGLGPYDDREMDTRLDEFMEKRKLTAGRWIARQPLMRELRAERRRRAL